MEPQYYDSPFFVKDNGIWMNKTIKGNETPVRLCNFTARITEDITCTNGVENERFLSIVGCDENGNSLRKITVPLKNFAQLEWAQEYWSMNCMNKQIELAINEKLYDFSDVEKFITDKSIRIEELSSQRNKVYNQIRRCTDPKRKESLVAHRDSLTSELALLRDKVNTAKKIIKDRPDLEMRVQAEKELLREWYFPERERSKQKYYESR